MEIELQIPLQSTAGNVWCVVRQPLTVELPDDEDDEEEELVACVPIELDVDGRTVHIEARFVAADLAAGVLAFEPIVLDPVPGEPGVVDEDGLVDGRPLVIEGV